MQTFRATLLVALASVASAGLPGSPKVWMTVDDTSLAGLESVGLKGTVDLDGIGDKDVNVSLEYDYNDLKMAPSTVVASVDRKIGDTNVNIKADFGVAEKTADVTITAVADGYTIVVEGDSSDEPLASIGLQTNLNLGGKSIDFNPVVNMRTKEVDVNADVELTKSASAHVEVNAMTQDATVEVTYDVDSENTLKPKWATGNKLSYGWTHKFSKDSTLDINFEPNENLSAEWTEGGWTTELSTPLSNPSDSKVSFKREWSL
jgi:hypothetical protein